MDSAGVMAKDDTGRKGIVYAVYPANLSGSLNPESGVKMKEIDAAEVSNRLPGECNLKIFGSERHRNVT